MKNYNLFTQTLLKQGYNRENFPPYARLPNGYSKKEMFDLFGGFEYQPWYLKQKVYVTGCGLLCKGSYLSNGYMSFMGIDWKPENNNPVLCCPYRIDHCSLRHSLLDPTADNGGCQINFCDCHETHLSYDYEHSVDKEYDKQEKAKKAKYKDFEQRVHGHVCQWHMYYHDRTEKWEQIYSPIKCARMCQNIGGICSLRHPPISSKRGNIFYDVKITKHCYENILQKQEVVIKKGCQFFDTGKSLTICEETLKRCKSEIIERVLPHYTRESLVLEWDVEVLNIRVESRESRDLIQDLADIHDGITIIHASDQKQNQTEAKRARRKSAKEKRIQKLEKLIIETGLDQMESYSIDSIHVHKWLTSKRLTELQLLHEEREEKLKIQPVQMTLSDLL